MDKAQLRQPGPPKRRKLYRSKTDRVVAGVCGGLAVYTKTDATLIRMLFVAPIFFGGVGLLLYLLMWIIVPSESKATPEEHAEPPG